jgi:hypothetical protein
MPKDNGHWIEDAHMKKGKLHKELGVKKGKKIPAKKLAKAEHSVKPVIRREANLARTLSGLRK